MSDGFNVNVAELRQHATTVAQIASGVHSASGPASGALSGDAYGAIGQFFVQAIMSAMGDTMQGFLKAAVAVDNIHQGLVQIANLYEQVDKLNANTFGGTQGSIV